MHTPLVEVRLAGQRKGGDAAALIAERNARVPMGQMGDAWDVAYAALSLASDEAKFDTGAEIVVDGGLTLKCNCVPSKGGGLAGGLRAKMALVTAAGAEGGRAAS